MYAIAGNFRADAATAAGEIRPDLGRIRIYPLRALRVSGNAAPNKQEPQWAYVYFRLANSDQGSSPLRISPWMAHGRAIYGRWLVFSIYPYTEVFRSA